MMIVGVITASVSKPLWLLHSVLECTSFLERRPPYGDDRAPYGDAPPARGGYDDRRIPPGPGGYDDRRPLLGDRRGPIDDQGIRGPPASYDRSASSSDMFSRRDAGPKPL